MPYKDPKQKKRHDRDYYQLHKEKLIEQKRTYEKTHQKERRKWEAKYREGHREELRNRQRIYNRLYPERRALASQKWNQKLRLEVLTAYGGNPPRCACCGEGHIEFLGIDHIYGGGHKHRRQIGMGQNLYRWLKANNYPDGYRALCHNCNLSLGFYGYCPHQLDKAFLPEKESK